MAANTSKSNLVRNFENEHNDIVKLLIPVSEPEMVEWMKWMKEGMDKRNIIDESIFIPVSKSQYEERRNQAGADLIFVLINDEDMLGQTDNTRRKYKFQFSGSSLDSWYFHKRIPYKGHTELADKIMDEMNIEAGRKIVQKWYIRGRFAN